MGLSRRGRQKMVISTVCHQTLSLVSLQDSHKPCEDKGMWTWRYWGSNLGPSMCWASVSPESSVSRDTDVHPQPFCLLEMSRAREHCGLYLVQSQGHRPMYGIECGFLDYIWNIFGNEGTERVTANVGGCYVLIGSRD